MRNLVCLSDVHASAPYIPRSPGSAHVVDITINSFDGTTFSLLAGGDLSVWPEEGLEGDVQEVVELLEVDEQAVGNYSSSSSSSSNSSSRSSNTRTSTSTSKCYYFYSHKPNYKLIALPIDPLSFI